MIGLYPILSGLWLVLLLIAGIDSAYATDIAIRPLGDNKRPEKIEIMINNEGGGTPLASQPDQPLVFRLPPPAAGSWEESLSVSVDDVTIPLRVTRYHRQLETLRVPVYLNPSPPADINNPQVQDIEPSKAGSETNEQNVIKYFKSAYALNRISIVDGQFPARVELAYFDRALRVTADYTYIPVTQQASSAVANYIARIPGARKLVDRLFAANSGYSVSVIDYAQFEQWTDLFLLKSEKLKSVEDQCALIAYYLSKYDELSDSATKTVSAIIRFDANSWNALRDRYKTGCQTAP